MSGHDWTQDFELESGDYQCQCCICDVIFTGHKARVVCKLCSSSEVTAFIGAIRTNNKEGRMSFADKIHERSKNDRDIIVGSEVRRALDELRRERDSVRKGLLDLLTGAGAAYDVLKNDMLKLLPIARENTTLLMRHLQTVQEDQRCEDELSLIEELTEKYAKKADTDE